LSDFNLCRVSMNVLSLSRVSTEMVVFYTVIYMCEKCAHLLTATAAQRVDGRAADDVHLALGLRHRVRRSLVRGEEREQVLRLVHAAHRRRRHRVHALLQAAVHLPAANQGEGAELLVSRARGREPPHANAVSECGGCETVAGRLRARRTHVVVGSALVPGASYTPHAPPAGA